VGLFTRKEQIGKPYDEVQTNAHKNVWLRVKAQIRVSGSIPGRFIFSQF